MGSVDDELYEEYYKSAYYPSHTYHQWLTEQYGRYVTVYHSPDVYAGVAEPTQPNTFEEWLRAPGNPYASAHNLQLARSLQRMGANPLTARVLSDTVTERAKEVTGTRTEERISEASAVWPFDDYSLSHVERPEGDEFP